MRVILNILLLLITELMQSNPVALDHWNKANLYHKISIGGMVTQFAFTFWTFRQLNNLETSYIPIYIMVAATIPTIAFDFMSRNSRKNALLQYNAGLRKSIISKAQHQEDKCKSQKKAQDNGKHSSFTDVSAGHNSRFLN